MMAAMRSSVLPPKLRRYHMLDNVNSRTFTPREYQVELLDAARKHNTIVCLGTGAGKTFIAVMVIKELAHEIRANFDAGGKRSVFLTPTGPLVHQQAKVIQDYTDLNVGKYSGKEFIFWTKEMWENELKKNQVLVLTPDIFKMILHHGFLPVSKVNLLIFDECHRAVKNHPYCGVLECFDVCSKENQPRILGLSASLVSGRCKPSKIAQEVKNLELKLMSTVETASDLTVSIKYGCKPQEYLVLYRPYFNNSSCFVSFLTLLESALDFLDDINIQWNSDEQHLPHPCRQPRRYLIEISRVLMTLGLWCAKQASQVFLNEIDSILDFLDFEEHRRFLIMARTILLTIFVQCNNLFKEKNSLSQLLDFAPPKLLELLKVLKRYKPDELAVIKLPETVENINLAPTIGHMNGSEKECSGCHSPDYEQFRKSEDDNSHSFNNEKNTEKELQKSENFPKSKRISSDIISVKNNNNAFLSKSEGFKRGYASNQHGVDDSKTLCGVVFVKQQITAFLLNKWLSSISQHDPDYSFISSNSIVGHAKCGSTVKGSWSHAFRKQEEVLQKFRSREYNLIVATSVVEEGMDIPKCNLVVRFDVPENFSSYIQSKGRARAPDSLFVVMVCENEREKFVENFCDFKTIEEILLEKCHKADSSIDELIPEQKVDLIMEPYMPIKQDGSARVTLSSSISLVNRYCAKLPSDTFTRLTPKWKIKEVHDGESSGHYFQCIIHLPINSPLKRPIIGRSMQSKQLSKMAAALKTCEELHKAGELDDNLLPTGKEAVKFEEEINEDAMEEQTLPGTARPGTTKRRQYYFKQVAEALKGSSPKVETPCCLYSFRMVLTCPIPEEQNTRGRKIHDPADTLRGFGIVCSKPVPAICSFPVFTRSGEVTVCFEHLSSDLRLSENQLELLSYFHKYTFAEVLRLEKYPMIYDPLQAESSFFVVPVNQCTNSEVFTIDWQFVEIINNQRSEKPRKLSEEERVSFNFINESYTDAVVMPWYRNLDKPQFFYVAEICKYLNPKSDFPDTGYETFENYYRRKYDISIMNNMQPLLDVDHTSARLNLLTPRYVNRKGVTLPTSSEQTKKTKRENLQQKQILIPELCIIHPFPASLWRKAVCLPCILYRVNSLLLAEQLRLSVAQSISVGMVELPTDFKWPMLDFGWTLSDVLRAQAALKESENQIHEISLEQPVVAKNEATFTALSNVSVNGANEAFNCNHSANNTSADFEIGVFDPSKHQIPDDYDEELAEINFSEKDFPVIPVSNFPMWNSVTSNERDDSPEMPMIRYGSPSNFEGTGWDSEWDTEVEDNTFFSLNLPGLDYISAPGVFNMESLSMDLASCRDDDDLWDSMEEDSLFDETELENIPACIKPFSPPESVNEIFCSVNRPSNREVWESEWLPAISLPRTMEGKYTEQYVCDTQTEIQVSEKREQKKGEIRFLDKASSGDSNSINIQNEFPKFNKIFFVPDDIEMSQEICDSVDKGTAGLGDESEQTIQDMNHFNASNFDEILAKNNTEGMLAFGELLPNREEVQILEDDPFRVYFDESPDLSVHPGPSPSIILQAFTMSNANDGINLERLETVGDSFLKYAITAYLFCMYSDIHEGKLSYLRSKQISNLNLYRLGKRKCLGELMVATKFEPNDNWLPPNYTVPKGLEEALIESGLPVGHWNIGNLSDLTQMNEEQIRQSVIERKEIKTDPSSTCLPENSQNSFPLIPYNLLTQHSIPDKSVADCVEALIGAYLVSCGSCGALLFMSWLGLKVLPKASPGNGKAISPYCYLKPPSSPLLMHIPKAQSKLEKLLSGYSMFEKKIDYFFNDKSYLLQAFTHASYHYNILTDCYQRLEFLGDAVLDYLITRHLYEDPKKHSPGTLTDLRSALVNNTFFASLAVKYDFHKYFKAISPGLFNVIKKFVELKEKDKGYENYEQAYYLEEEECEEAEEVEVPKALGDIFESVAGAIYLDSNMSLDTVWRVYFAMMKPEIEYFSTHVPKSPIRELLEMEPQTAKFERAEMTLSGKVRVRVEVFGKGQFVGVGRNKRIAKCTAAKRALRELKKMKREKEASKRN